MLQAHTCGRAIRVTDGASSLRRHHLAAQVAVCQILLVNRPHLSQVLRVPDIRLPHVHQIHRQPRLRPRRDSPAMRGGRWTRNRRYLDC